LATGDGATDLPGAAGLLAVGADDGAGVLAERRVLRVKNEMAVAAARFNIVFIVSWSPPPESNIASIMTALELDGVMRLA